MDTRHLKIFVTVYKMRSFTKAAQALFTSQPTISEHMRNLENSLNCRLFDRLGRSIMPTVQADLLYPKAVEILDEMDKITETISAASDIVSGELLIGASTIPGEYMIPGFAASFKNRYPDISFQILISDSAQIVKKVQNNELFLGIVGAQSTFSKIEYTRFAGDDLILAVSARANLPEEIDAGTIYDLDFLLREQGSGTRKNMEKILGDLNLNTSRLSIRATLGSSTAIKEAIKSGLGVSIISRIAVSDELASGVLKEIKVKGLEMKRDFFIAMQKNRSIPNHYKAFAEFLKSEQAGHAAQPK